MDRNFFILTWLVKSPQKSPETVECYLKAETLIFHFPFRGFIYKASFGYLTISQLKNRNSFDASLNHGCVLADESRLGAVLQNLVFAGHESGLISGPSFKRSDWMWNHFPWYSLAGNMIYLLFVSIFTTILTTRFSLRFHSQFHTSEEGQKSQYWGVGCESGL